MGTTLDLTRSACMELAVEIVDSDSAQVEISQLEPLLAGAELTQTDGLRADWSWCPTDAQMDADDRYTLVLGADDGANPRTAHPYLVVLRRPTKPDCPGQAPAIVHEARDLDTVAGLAITAEISDDLGLKHEPLLYYSSTRRRIRRPVADDPAHHAPHRRRHDGRDLDRERAQPGCRPAGRRQGRPLIPHRRHRRRRSEGACDHLTQAPATGVFDMAVTNPGGEGGGALCEPCSHDVQCGGVDDLCVPVGTSSDAFCLSACEGPDDCPADYTCSPEPVASVNGASARQCVPQSIDCADPGGGVCEDDAREDNDSETQAATAPLLAAGSHDDLVSCPATVGTGDDEDWFEIQVNDDTQLGLGWPGEMPATSPGLYDLDGALIDSSLAHLRRGGVACGRPARTWPACSRSARSATRIADREQGRDHLLRTCEADENREDDGPAQARCPTSSRTLRVGRSVLAPATTTGTRSISSPASACWST